MRKIFFSFCILISSLSLISQSQNKQTPAQPKVRVYYFYTDERCQIDQSVEENTKKVMQTFFLSKIKEGKIDFKFINTDDKANAKLVSNFDINAQALYIVKNESGKEIKTDLTRFAFDNSFSNPLKFKKGLKDEIEKNLN